MADDAEKRPVRLLIDELAIASVRIRTLGRLAQTSIFAIEQELFSSIFKRVINMPLNVYLTGSRYEGIPLGIFNDTDEMVNFRESPVVLWKCPEKGEMHEGRYVIAEQVLNQPAFLRIRKANTECLNMDVTIDNNGYLKSSDFTTPYNTLIKNTSKRQMYLTGPALTTQSPMVLVGRSDIAHYGGYLSRDVVQCLKCQSWPSITKSFFNRERPANWPSQELLKKISHLDCLVVAVGHPSSTQRDIEWRLSFSVAETKLSHEIFQPYFECMVVLKDIKNRYIKYDKRIKHTPFCSYFIKTACFWTCERFSHKDHRTMDLIRKVLSWLVDCYQRRVLPHYFIPEQNLIGHLSREDCDGVISTLSKIDRDLWKMVMSSFMFKGFSMNVDIINSLCDNLGIDGIKGETDCATLEQCLLKHPRARDEIVKTISKLLPNSFAFELVKYLTISESTSEKPHKSLILLLIEKLDQGCLSLDILKIPETFILPIVEKIEDIVPMGYGKTFNTYLYRSLGTMYAHLVMYLERRGVCIPDLYQDKVLHYYSLGNTMYFPNEELSDQGIGTLVLVLKYYYLKRDFRSAKGLLNKYEPSLCVVKKHTSFMCRLSNIIIQFENKMYFAFGAWAVDQNVHQLVIELRKLYIHPVALAFYIQARVSLEDGDAETVSRAVKSMEDSLKTTSVELVSDCTRLLIGVIKTLICIRELPFIGVQDINKI
ncbi:uncharacterized protein LOC117104067 [Anneissia japonica]|uniref:uncharacterized protein LOC117104067 n=1 Tax=Anneissia japonica TaxID=1529436 RepID=UPI0014256CE9|nr:uncharacterized protein LOC117104067 [Anneissia japonica]